MSTITTDPSAADFIIDTSGQYNDLPSWYYGSTIYSRIDATTARNVFTTAFLVLNLLIAMVGGYFLKQRNQRRLILRPGKTVPFALLTPWLSLASCASYLWKTRTLPGGWLGLLMIASGIFGTLQHYMVNSFISPIPLPDWCNFTAGIVTTSFEGELQPSPSWPAAFLVFQANTSVIHNGGAVGIYNKVNQTTLNFRPVKADVLGTWNCTKVADSTLLPGDWANTSTLQSWLDAQKFLDPSTENIGSAVDAEAPFTGQYLGFMAWSGIFDSSVPHTSWKVKSTIANGLFGSNSSKIASNFECSLVRTNSTWTPTPMPTNYTLMGWKDIMYGFTSQSPVDQYATQLTTTLNAMSMLAGSGNRNNLHISAGDSARFGCLSPGAQINVGVYLIVLFLFAILLVLLIADLYAFVLYRMNKRRKIIDVEEIPTDLISWQLNMMRRMTRDHAVKTTDLKKYSYTYSAETGDFEFLDSKSGARGLGDTSLGSTSYDAGDHVMKEYPKNTTIASSQTLLEDGQYVAVEQ